MQMQIHPSPIALELSDVTLVDADAVRFLAVAEAAGTELRNCPLFVREWIRRGHPELTNAEEMNQPGSMYLAGMMGLKINLQKVGVGITIAHDPLHGSGRADFPHPALTLGDDAHAAQRIRMIECEQEATSGQSAAAFDPRGHGRSGCGVTKRGARASLLGCRKRCSAALVHGHAIVADVPTQLLIAATDPLPGWVRACVAEVRLLPRSASLATVCGSSAATL